MIGLTGLDVYNFNFKVTEENNKLALYKFPDSYNPDFSYTKSEMRLKEIWELQIL